jgi:hypothetical protein
MEFEYVPTLVNTSISSTDKENLINEQMIMIDVLGTDPKKRDPFKDPLDDTANEVDANQHSNPYIKDVFLLLTTELEIDDAVNIKIFQYLVKKDYHFIYSLMKEKKDISLDDVTSAVQNNILMAMVIVDIILKFHINKMVSKMSGKSESMIEKLLLKNTFDVRQNLKAYTFAVIFKDTVRKMIYCQDAENFMDYFLVELNDLIKEKGCETIDQYDNVILIQEMETFSKYIEKEIFTDVFFTMCAEALEALYTVIINYEFSIERTGKLLRQFIYKYIEDINEDLAHLMMKQIEDEIEGKTKNIFDLNSPFTNSLDIYNSYFDHKPNFEQHHSKTTPSVTESRKNKGPKNYKTPSSVDLDFDDYGHGYNHKSHTSSYYNLRDEYPVRYNNVYGSGMHGVYGYNYTSSNNLSMAHKKFTDLSEKKKEFLKKYNYAIEYRTFEYNNETLLDALWRFDYYVSKGDFCKGLIEIFKNNAELNYFNDYDISLKVLFKEKIIHDIKMKKQLEEAKPSAEANEKSSVESSEKSNEKSTVESNEKSDEKLNLESDKKSDETKNELENKPEYELSYFVGLLEKNKVPEIIPFDLILSVLSKEFGIIYEVFDETNEEVYMIDMTSENNNILNKRYYGVIKYDSDKYSHLVPLFSDEVIDNKEKIQID